MELLFVTLFVVGVIFFLVGRAARSAPAESEEQEQPPKPGASSGHFVVRCLVHRVSLIDRLEDEADGMALVDDAHEALLAETDLSVLVVMEDPNDRGGALRVATESMSLPQLPAERLREVMLDNARSEVEALPTAWVERVPGVWACASSDGRAAVRLLSPKHFASLPIPLERAVVMAPTQDLLLVIDRERAASWGPLCDEAEKAWPDADWFTLTSYSWSGTAWRNFLEHDPAEKALSPEVRSRLTALEIRGVTQDFRDAAESFDFPPVRLSSMGAQLVGTWLEGTSVSVPSMRPFSALRLVTSSCEVGPTLRGEVAVGFMGGVTRYVGNCFWVLDEARFPPPEVRAFLEAFCRLPAQASSSLPSAAACDLMRGHDTLVLFGFEPLVLFADGRVVKVEEGEDDELEPAPLLKAMKSAALRAWAERVLEGESNLGREAEVTVRTLQRLADAVEAGGSAKRAALQALEKPFAEGLLRERAMVAAVEVALSTEDRALATLWLRRGVKERPLDQRWRTTLTGLQFASLTEPEAQLQGNQIDELGARACLMPVLRPPGHAERAEAELRELARRQGGDPSKLVLPDPLRWPVGRGIEFELVYDLGKKMQPLSMLHAAGGLATELKRVALLNLESASGGGLPQRDGAWVADWTDGFAASRLLLPWPSLDWSTAEQRTLDVLAFTPVYDGFVVAPAGDERALDAALREAERLIDEANQPQRQLLTALPWRYDAQKRAWVEHELAASHPLASRVQALEAKLRARAQ